MTTALRHLPTSYRDVCAAELRLRLDLPSQEALATRTLVRGDWAVHLRILGASHQVLLEHRGATLCSETVACDATSEGPATHGQGTGGHDTDGHHDATYDTGSQADGTHATGSNDTATQATATHATGSHDTGGHGAGLVTRHVRDRAGSRYRFRSATSRLRPSQLGAQVDGLLEDLLVDPGALCGVYPGDAWGMTGIRARIRSDRAVSWRTWHTYPQTGEVVVTCTRVALRSPGPDLGRA